MSEPNSLYLKIEIGKEQFDKFLQSRPIPLAVDDNVLAWWQSRKMHSPMAIDTVPQQHLHHPYADNASMIAGFVSDKRLAARQLYNEAEQTWTFLILQFSENYLEILPMIAFLRQLAAYQNKEEKGVALIYDFLWDENSLMAHLDFSGQLARLTNISETTEINPEIMNGATKHLQNWCDELTKQYDE